MGEDRAYVVLSGAARLQAGQHAADAVLDVCDIARVQLYLVESAGCELSGNEVLQRRAHATHDAEVNQVKSSRSTNNAVRSRIGPSEGV